MNHLLNRLLLWQKFLVLAILAAILVAVPIALFLHETNKTIDDARVEEQGIVPVRMLFKLIQAAQQYRGLSTMTLNGYGAVKTQSYAKQRETDQDLVAMDGIVRGMEEPAITRLWKQIQQDWSRLGSKASSGELSAKENFVEHTLFIEQLLKLHELLIDHFRLRLDADPDAYFLIDAVLVESPQLGETLGRIRGAGAAALAAGEASIEERMFVHSMTDRAMYQFDAVKASLAHAMNANSTLGLTLTPAIRNNEASLNKVVSLAQNQIVYSSRLDYPPWEYFAQFTDTMSSQQQMNDTALIELDNILHNRTSALSTTKNFLMCGIFLLSLFVVIVSHRIIASVARPLKMAWVMARAMTAGSAEKICAIESIGDGNLESDIAFTEIPVIDKEIISKDEVGELMQAIIVMSEMQRSLDGALDKMRRSLRSAMDKAVESEKLASLGGIVAGVAHELNTPIGNLIIMASTLGDWVADLGQSVQAGTLTKKHLGEIADECKSASAIIVRNANRAGELVAGFKKIAIDQTSNRKRIFDLHDTVADILHSMGSVMRDTNVTFELHIPAGIQMDSYPGELDLIFSNLISNSIHHGFKERGSGHIVINGKQYGNLVEIDYQDDGIGIEAHLHSKVFEPFYTTRLGQGGSGLGLFIVYNSIHGTLKGDIKLASEAGQGVRFTLTLPSRAC